MGIVEWQQEVNLTRLEILVIGHVLDARADGHGFRVAEDMVGMLRKDALGLGGLLQLLHPITTVHVDHDDPFWASDVV